MITMRGKAGIGVLPRSGAMILGRYFNACMEVNDLPPSRQRRLNFYTGDSIVADATDRHESQRPGQ